MSRRRRFGDAEALVAAMALSFSLCLGSADARAAGTPTPTPVDDLARDVGEAFQGDALLLYAAAVADTSVMVLGGGDHRARVLFRESIRAEAWGDAANLVGYVLPVLVAPAIWGTGLLSGDRGWVGAGSAAVQALAVTAAATVLLKWATGRPYPLNGGDPRAPDVLLHPEYARRFSPFNLRGDWAWPSGHTSTITAVVAALSGWAPESRAIPLIGYPVCAAIGVGMIAGDHHWTSDVIAGGLVGYAIGSSIGASFRRRAGGDGDSSGRIHLVPFGAAGPGASLVGAW